MSSLRKKTTSFFGSRGCIAPSKRALSDGQRSRQASPYPLRQGGLLDGLLSPDNAHAHGGTRKGVYVGSSRRVLLRSSVIRDQVAGCFSQASESAERHQPNDWNLAVCLALILRETRRDAHNLLPGRIALLCRQRDRVNLDPTAVAFYEYLIRMLGQIEIPGRVLGCAPKRGDDQRRAV